MDADGTVVYFCHRGRVGDGGGGWVWGRVDGGRDILTFHVPCGHIWVMVFMSAQSLQEGKGPACFWQYCCISKISDIFQ